MENSGEFSKFSDREITSGKTSPISDKKPDSFEPLSSQLRPRQDLVLVLLASAIRICSFKRLFGNRVFVSGLILKLHVFINY